MYKIIISIIIISISICVFYLLSNKKQYITEEDSFVVEPNKKKYIVLNRDKFNDMEIKEGYNYYYFPDECPSYKEDFILMTLDEGVEKFFVPEKNHLICIHNNHKWIKEPKNFEYWKK